MGWFHSGEGQIHAAEPEPISAEAAEKLALYEEMGSLIEEAKTLPGFPPDVLGIAIGEYEAARLVQFTNSSTNNGDLRTTVQTLSQQIARFRPSKTVH